MKKMVLFGVYQSPMGKVKIVRRGSEPQNNDRRGRSRGVHGVNGADSTSGSYFEKSEERRGVIAPTPP